MLERLNQHYPIRFTVFFLALAGLSLSAIKFFMFSQGGLELAVCLVLTGIGVHDLQQKQHAVLRNYPSLGTCAFYSSSSAQRSGSTSLRAKTTRRLFLERSAPLSTQEPKTSRINAPLAPKSIFTHPATNGSLTALRPAASRAPTFG